MDRPATANPATAREIILEIVRNMREGLEPLHYTTLPPALYHVYLHPDDMERLRGIASRIVEEARRALDAEVEALNRGSMGERLGERLKFMKRSDPKIVVPESGWQIQLLENTDDDTQPGDIVIHSELALPAKGDIGAGSMTKRIATRRMGGSETVATPTYAPAAKSEQKPTATDGAAQPAQEPRLGVDASAPFFATIEYEDNGGRKSYGMTKDQIVVGRGGRDYWTDLKLETLPDVSREHFRLRRDPATGEFFLKDLSRLGTTINGEKAPSSIEFVEGEKRDKNVEAPVPAQARIGLAGVLFLEFRSSGNG
jgi:hypothetical protein